MFNGLWVCARGPTTVTHTGGNPAHRSDHDITQQLEDLIASLQGAEGQAKSLLQLTRSRRLFFGLAYDYVDEDIAHLLGHLHYMRLVATNWEEQQAVWTRQPDRERIHALRDAGGPEGADAQRKTRENHSTR
jgi:hypothetical protein